MDYLIAKMPNFQAPLESALVMYAQSIYNFKYEVNNSNTFLEADHPIN